MVDSYQFSIPLGGQDFKQKLAFAEQFQLGVEVAAFATGPAVYEMAVRTRICGELRAALEGFPHPPSYHGAFVDLSLHSEDPAIAEIARRRIARDLDTASLMGCRKVVFHTGFNPLVPLERYEEEFMDRHAAFWPRCADQWPDLTICLENLWELCPRILERLVQSIMHPRVGLCLDVAHAHVYSNFAAVTWVEQLKGSIAHLHWNDNCGDSDSHLPIGMGNIPWRNVVAAIGALREVIVVLELNSLEAIRQSLRYLSELDLASLVAQSADGGINRHRGRADSWVLSETSP